MVKKIDKLDRSCQYVHTAYATWYLRMGHQIMFLSYGSVLYSSVQMFIYETYVNVVLIRDLGSRG